ncbi:thymidine phosphorylase [bacterium]|nr:thymidine phosphorylase [bacterium]
MRVYDVIYKKRNGGTLSKEEIDFLIKGYVEGSIPDYQISAFLMAVFFRSMDFDETLELTNAMIGSGVSYQFDDMEFPTVDKHSTGGVGDKISIPLVPIVTSFDVIVPMMSGRGLGHTGGTLDKLESIPGFRVDYDDAGFLSLLKINRCAMIGQTGRIAPADKKLYALRDVTATVDSIPLITASIMSKKIAEGAMNFVFDVKYGSGAFMKSREEGEKLASYLTQTAKIAGRNADHVLSDMNVPLGRFIGNRLEIIESMEILKGNGPEDTTQLTEKLAAKMLVLCGLFHDEDSALSKIHEKYSTGEYLDRMKEIIQLQNGDPRVIEDYSIMKPAKNIFEYKAAETGRISRMDAYLIGLAALATGAGREKKEDKVDHSCGLELLKKPGDPVTKGESVILIHYNKKDRLESAKKYIKEGLSIE